MLNGHGESPPQIMEQRLAMPVSLSPNSGESTSHSTTPASGQVAGYLPRGERDAGALRASHLKPSFPSGLYAITRETADTARLLTQVEAALAGGAAAVQYRDKSDDVARRHEQASELVALCHRYQVPLIINDDLRLADLCGADGVHLGRDDGSVAKARVILGPDKFIGASCHQSLELAVTAQAEDADYVAFGSFYPSASKPQAERAELTLLHAARSAIHVPIVAIGGITLSNALALLDAGADSLAVLSALFNAPDIHVAAHAFNQLFVSEPED